MRLDKYLAETTGLTRNDAKALIKKAQVSVNGAVIKDAGFSVREKEDRVIVSGKEVRYSEFYYYVLNKPAGYVVSTDERDGIPVKNLLPEEMKNRLQPVGRLDKETTGILLFTDDGVFSHELLSPKKHVDKTYFTVCEKEVTSEDLEKLRNGVAIGDGEVAAPAVAEYVKSELASGVLNEECLSGDSNAGTEESKHYSILLTIHEGKFHQVKRMMQATCNKVVSLKRVAFGKLKLEDLNLAEGEGVFIEKSDIL